MAARSVIEAPCVSLTFHWAVTPAATTHHHQLLQLPKPNIKMEPTGHSDTEQKQHDHFRRAPQPEDEGSSPSHDGQILTTTCASLQEGAPASPVLLKKNTQKMKSGGRWSLLTLSLSLSVLHVAACFYKNQRKQTNNNKRKPKKMLVHSFEGAFA